jgi:hypothetical protein
VKSESSLKSKSDFQESVRIAQASFSFTFSVLFGPFDALIDFSIFGRLRHLVCKRTRQGGWP